jgi:hypothetical protein
MAARIPVKSQRILLLLKKSFLLKTQQLILGPGTAFWWLTEPDWLILHLAHVSFGWHFNKSTFHLVDQMTLD